MFGFKKRRRRRLRDQPFPEAWRETLTAGVPYYRRLPETDREELHGHIHVLLDEKNFEGCGGMRLDDAVRLAIAAHAGILLLHRETEYYPRLYSILVYPYDFIVEKLVHHEDDPLHVIGEDVLSGEAWAQGAVILSWDGMLKSVKHDRDGYNVAIHEFAHQLDMENGPPDGFPYIRDRALRADWARIMHAEFDRLQRDVDRPRHRTGRLCRRGPRRVLRRRHRVLLRNAAPPSAPPPGTLRRAPPVLLSGPDDVVVT